MGVKVKSKKTKKIKSLREDLAKVDIPFDLFTGMALVIDELESSSFIYDHTTNDVSTIITFESKKLKERVTINVEEENLLIRQFTIKGKSRKLKVIYVVKPTERTFNLIKQKINKK